MSYEVNLVIVNLTPGVVIGNETAKTVYFEPVGSDYIRLPPLGYQTFFMPGDSIKVQLEFINPLYKTIRYTPKVVTGAGI